MVVCLLGGVRSAFAQQIPGGLDTTFNPGLGGSNAGIVSLALQPDGKILVGGNFTSVNGVARTSLARLNTDGSLDTTFNPAIYNSGTGVAGLINSVALRTDGKMMVCGTYTTVNGTARSGPVRLNADGTLDTNYDATKNVYNVNGVPVVVAPQADGKVVVGGSFGIQRTNADGSVDTGFEPSSGNGSYNTSSADGLGSTVYDIAVQTDGKILFAGHFNNFAGAARPGLARVNADGTLDAGFVPAYKLDVYGTIHVVTVQPDGRVMYAGDDYIQGEDYPGILGRLNADGSLDPSFHAGFQTDSVINAVAVQGDGKILIGGRFGNKVARLNADGSADATFTGATAASGTTENFVTAIALQPNANILLGGSFTMVDGTARNAIARLSGDHFPFLDGEVELKGAVYYLAFSNGDYFGYYSYLADPHYIYHLDLGYEYVFDANDGKSGVYLYDFESGGFFYTSPSFPFPYLYDFKLNSTLYYFPDPHDAGRYNTNGTRYFYEFATGQIISK